MKTTHDISIEIGKEIYNCRWLAAYERQRAKNQDLKCVSEFIIEQAEIYEHRARMLEIALEIISGGIK